MPIMGADLTLVIAVLSINTRALGMASETETYSTMIVGTRVELYERTWRHDLSKPCS